MFAVRSTSAVAANAAAIRRVGAKKFNPLAAHVARKAPVAKARFSVQANSSSPSPDGEVDLYRDTPLRYMGYSNEVGEAFVAFLPGWGVPASYGVAGTSRARPPSRTFEIPARNVKISPRPPPRGDARGARRSSIPPKLTAPIPPLLTRSALYVLADTIDKGKKAADGEAGACPCTLLGTTTNATRKHIRFSSEPQPWNRSRFKRAMDSFCVFSTASHDGQNVRRVVFLSPCWCVFAAGD